MWNEKLLIVLLFTLGIVSRAPFIESMQSHWDGPQFSIAVSSYDFSQETPAPPGYPLYIFFGLLLNHYIYDPHQSLLVLSVLLSGITSVFFYVGGKIIFSRRVGIIASVLYLTSPTFYFFGLTPYPYIMTPLVSVSLAIICYLIIVKKERLGLILGAITALGIGVRPQDSIILFPLALYAFINLNYKQKLFSFLIFLIFFLVWFVPQLIVVGGIETYFSSLSKSLESGAITPFSFDKLLTQISRSVKGFGLTFGIASLSVPIFLIQIIPYLRRKNIITNKIIFFLLWIMPSVLFTMFIRNDHAGYQMTYLSAFVLVIAYILTILFKKREMLLYITVLIVAMFNLFWFFRNRDPYFSKPYIPTSFHYSEIIKNDLQMKQKVTYIQKNFDPYNTVIITSSQYFRPTMYHLPQYEVFSYGVLETKEKEFSSIARIGKNFRREEYVQENSHVVFDNSVSTIVFFDREVSDIVKNEGFVHKLLYNATMVSLSHKYGNVYIIGYKTFEVSHE